MGIRDITDDVAQLRQDKGRIINLLSDIVHEASTNPLRLVAYLSPLLQLATLEIWAHNNPEEALSDDFAASRAKLLATIADRNRP